VRVRPPAKTNEVNTTSIHHRSKEHLGKTISIHPGGPDKTFSLDCVFDIQSTQQDVSK
jgi:hypothetical protein